MVVQLLLKFADKEKIMSCSEVSAQHKANGIWVRVHDGHIENERCDKLAKDEAEKVKNGE